MVMQRARSLGIARHFPMGAGTSSSHASKNLTITQLALVVDAVFAHLSE
jgi:hypothetical protein